MLNHTFRVFVATLSVMLPAAIEAADAPPSKLVPAALVKRIKVLPDRAPDCSSLRAIVESVTRGCQTNDEKAIAIYNFMRLTHYHRAYPSEPGGVPVLKEINCYGWSLCGGLHAEQSALWREMGWPWRFVGWPGHTTVEAFYDGRWHYLDVFLKFYAWMPDANLPAGRTIAGQTDLRDRSQELLLEAMVMDPSRKVMYAKDNQFELIGEQANWQAPALLVCGDELSGIVEALKHTNRVGPAEDWAGINHATGDYSADVALAPGFALTNTWDRSEGAWYWAGSQIAPCHTCGDKEIRNSPEKGPVAEPYLGPDWSCESYANGVLSFRPDLSSEACLASFAALENARVADGGLVVSERGRPARVTVRLQSPYIFTRATCSAIGDATLETSVDEGRSWQAADLADFGPSLAGHVKALARLTFRDRLRDLHIDATVQNNPFTLPFLSPGKNRITVSVADASALGDNRLVVTYAYRVGARRKSYEQLYLEGKEIARGHDASWDNTPTVVQKTFTAGELPATFEIDVPTPRDLHAVYPRMLFVRREVLSPGEQPRPLPEGAQPPKMGPTDELKTLPNPLLSGIGRPPARPVRPVRTTTIELTASHFVSGSGEVPTTDSLKWPKTANEKVERLAYLIGGELTDLPAASDLAAARVVFPVRRAHQHAPTKVGLTALAAPFAANQPFDFKNLGDVLGTAVVPTLADDAPDWSPPETFAIDVTRHLRAVLAGAAEHRGFALRVVPDRGVDDGWTVRVQFPPRPRVYLEIDAYVDASDNVPDE